MTADDRSEVYSDPGHGLVNVISTPNTKHGAVQPGAQRAVVWKIFLLVPALQCYGGAGRGGGMQESWTRQHAATRASLHVYHWTRVCGGAAGGSWGQLGTSESMSAHNQSWPLAPGQLGTWSFVTLGTIDTSLCVYPPTISNNLYIICRKNHSGPADAIS